VPHNGESSRARTRRYYDEFTLLRPSHVGSGGHRYYEREQLLRLQQSGYSAS